MSQLLHQFLVRLAHPLLHPSRRMRGRLPGSVEALEQKILLSAATGAEDIGHDDARLDILGNEYHALEVPDEDLAELGTADGTGNFDGAGTISDLSQTFFLHSNPGAAHTIYLDFDGHLTSGTSWNSAFTGGADFVTPAYSFEGDASFSDGELTRIQAIWQRVAEDFLPFDVNVTTQDPGTAALSKSGSGDRAWGIRVVVGGNGSWYSSGYGGVAYRSSFNSSIDMPTFVFEDNLGNGHEKYTAEAISHEVGHTLGLAHDGGSGTSYYQGHGSGETGWASIMGVGYYQNLSQWSRGEYSGANNIQDDLAIITSQNGFGYRGDDVGDSAGSAATLFVSAGIVEDSGIIEQSSDVDVFVFTTGAGTINFQGLVAGRGANLDLLLELYDANGQLVAWANPTEQLSASFSVTVESGVYYLYVSGAGKGDPSGTGYSDYGSLGSYRLSGTIIESSETFPAYLAISPASVDQNEGHSGSTAFTFTVERTGDTTSGVSAGWVVSGNSADASDFAGGILPSGTVQFAAGETLKTITIYVAGDVVIEGDETFSVMLLHPSVGAEITTSSVQATIRNDDQLQPSFLAISASTADQNEGDSGITAFTFTITRTGEFNSSVSVGYVVIGNGADAADFDGGVLPSGSITFAAGETSKTVTLLVAGDLSLEGDESFTVALVNPSSGAEITTSTAQGTIRNDDQLQPSYLAISANTADQNEGHSGTTAFTFTITRTGETKSSVSIDYVVTGNGADASDFAGGVLPSGTVSFAAGETAKTITIYVAGDMTVEGDEFFTVSLVNSSSAAEITTSTAQGAIRNDDQPQNNPTIGMYVWDILVDIRSRGKSTDFRIHVFVQHDSDGDGVAESSDETLREAFVTVVLSGPFSGTYRGFTNGGGRFSTDWITRLPNGSYLAEVTALSHSEFSRNVSLEPTVNDGDADGDGLADQAAAIGNETSTPKPSTTTSPERRASPMTGSTQRESTWGRTQKPSDEAETIATTGEESSDEIRIQPENASRPSNHAASHELFAQFGELLGDLL